MNFTVINYSKLNMTAVDDELFETRSPFTIVLEETNQHFKISITVNQNAKFDGLSIPKPFRWFLPEIDFTNTLYSAAGLVHDALYASELVSKSVADDIFRGILRDAGISRFKGSLAHWCVQTFAKKHYGKQYDKHNIRNYISMSIL